MTTTSSCWLINWNRKMSGSSFISEISWQRRRNVRQTSLNENMISRWLKNGSLRRRSLMKSNWLRYKSFRLKCILYKERNKPIANKTIGLDRDSNAGPLAPKVQIISLDHHAIYALVENSVSGANPIVCLSVNPDWMTAIFLDYLLSFYLM